VLFVAISNHFSLVAMVAAPTMLAAPALPAAQASCSAESCVTRVADKEDSLLSLPRGMDQCDRSGPAAACSLAYSPADYVPGTPALPAGQIACAADAGKWLPIAPAACGDATLAPLAPLGTGAQAGAIPGQNLPAGSLGTRLPSRLELTSDADTVATNNQVVLTATSTSTVTGTNLAIEIFDTTSNTLVGACAQGSQCSVAYGAMSGTHDFAAYAMRPSTTTPDPATALSSNHISVGWLESAIAASATVAGQGQSVTLVASSSIDVKRTGRFLEIYDLTTDSRITYCAMGTACATSFKQTAGGVHKIVGYVNGSPEAVSPPIYITWLDVSLSATSIGPKSGGTIYLKATTNADLANTPWVVGIYDEQGHLVDHACKTGKTCSVKAWMSGGTTPRYTAVVGALPSSKTTITSPAVHPAPPAAPSLVDVQAKSSAIEPTHLLWGVDSCKAFVGDVTGNLFSKVSRRLGTPDFWGRYLTNTICPGISQSEIALAASHHMGILPIYNDYNCSAVAYYATGRAYAAQAVAAAKRLGIPQGRVLAIDIEPPGAACPGAGGVDTGFISGWFDGVHGAGYVPVYYGNGTRGSEFARAWCAAVTAQPSIATGSDLWSFQPSLLGNFNRNRAPNYGPFDTGCAGNMLAWQYVLSGGNAVDVDQDEAISSLPLWYP
jgi:hypothetical protein